MVVVDTTPETRFDRDMLAMRLLDEVQRLMEPLRDLDEHQRLAIVAVVAAAQLMTVYERTVSAPIAPIGERFDGFVGTLHTEGGRLMAGLRKACLPESIAYATALALCHRERRRAEECERLTAAPAAVEMDCIMTQLEAMIGAMQRLSVGGYRPAMTAGARGATAVVLTRNLWPSADTSNA
jgi:hypothetical protein